MKRVIIANSDYGSPYGLDPYDDVEYMKRHADSLYSSIVRAYEEVNPKFRGNLKSTALHYREYPGMEYNKSAKEKLVRFINTELAEYELPTRNIYSKDGKYRDVDIIE